MRKMTMLRFILGGLRDCASVELVWMYCEAVRTVSCDGQVKGK